MKGCRKILIAVKDLGDTVLDKGLELASEEGGWVTVLKVLPPYEGDLDLTGVRNISDVMGRGQDELDRSALARHVSSRRALAKVNVEEGDASESINRIARQERCDIIVMGKARQKGIFERLFGDRVVERVLRESPCPVLLVEA